MNVDSIIFSLKVFQFGAIFMFVINLIIAVFNLIELFKKKKDESE